MSFRIEADGAFSIVMFFIAHLGLCAAYIQGGLVKLTDFPWCICRNGPLSSVFACTVRRSGDGAGTGCLPALAGRSRG